MTQVKTAIQPQFRFRPVRQQDLPMLAEWLREPTVARWFTENDAIDDLAAHLTDARIRQQIVLLQDRPIAYVQDYDIHGFEDHPPGLLPKGSRGIDTFIGAVGDQGQGHSSAYLMQLLAKMRRAGVPAFGIDPHPQNTAAIRAYGKVGFRPHDTRMTEWGLVLLMSLPADAVDPD